MSIQYTVEDSNPRPSECESLHITTRPGLPPYFLTYLLVMRNEIGRHKIYLFQE